MENQMNKENKHTKQFLISLKAKIKGLAAEGRRTRDFIARSKGNERYANWNVKRSIGVEARYHLIAYGLLRGLPYSIIEPNSGKKSEYFFNYEYIAQICQRHSFWLHKKLWTVDYIKKLMVME